MSKPGFCWVSPIFCVNDLPSSLVYYRDILGFDIAWQWSENEAFKEEEHPTFACVCRGECSLFLCEKGQGSPGAWVSLNVRSREELQTLFDEYRTAGADIVEEPQDMSWGMREMMVRDPDGNTFRLGCQVEGEAGRS